MDAITRYVGIEPYLERVFAPGDLEVARFFVVISLLMWVFVLWSILSSMLLRYTMRKPLPTVTRDRLLESAHGLRRAGRIARRTGYVLLAIGFAVSLPLLLIGIRSAWQSFALGAVMHFGITQPLWIITEIHSNMFEVLARPAQ